MCVNVHIIIIIGTANRFCTFEGVWEAVNTDNCTREVISALNNTVRFVQLLLLSVFNTNTYMYSIVIYI